MSIRLRHPHVKKHQYVIQKDDAVKNDHFVLSGLLKAYHTDNDGKNHIIQFAMEDW